MERTEIDSRTLVEAEQGRRRRQTQGLYEERIERARRRARLVDAVTAVIALVVFVAACVLVTR